jgi:hypothetical protein
MLAQCANSPCSASFLHLRDGRLFRLETEPFFQPTNAKETEYFWLCGPCSAGMTLHLVEDGTVAAIGLAHMLCNGPHVALNSVDRENGAFLRSVSFLPRSHPKST